MHSWYTNSWFRNSWDTNSCFRNFQRWYEQVWLRELIGSSLRRWFKRLPCFKSKEMDRSVAIGQLRSIDWLQWIESMAMIWANAITQIEWIHSVMMIWAIALLQINGEGLVGCDRSVGECRIDRIAQVKIGECTWQPWSAKSENSKNLIVVAYIIKNIENDWTEFAMKCKLHMERLLKNTQIIIVK